MNFNNIKVKTYSLNICNLSYIPWVMKETTKHNHKLLPEAIGISCGSGEKKI